MRRTLVRNFSTAASRPAVTPSQGLLDDGDVDRSVRARWRDFEGDDPYDPPTDDDEDYEAYRWEEVPDDGEALPPDELWDEDDWD